MRRIGVCAVSMCLLAAMVSGCVMVGVGPRYTRGNGIVQTRDYDMGEFEGIEIYGAIELYYTQGDVYLVSVETDENLFEYMHLDVSGNILNMSFVNIINATRMRVYITAPTLSSIDCSGAIDFKMQEEAIVTDKLEVDVSGVCGGTLLVEAGELRGSVAGAADFNIAGTCEDARLTVSGAGDVDASDLTAKRAKLNISGAGSIYITCEEYLEADISGAGTIVYYGDPEVDKSVSGAGSIRKGR